MIRTTAGSPTVARLVSHRLSSEMTVGESAANGRDIRDLIFERFVLAAVRRDNRVFRGTTA